MYGNTNGLNQCQYVLIGEFKMILRNRTKMSLNALKGCETTLDIDKQVGNQ